MPIFSSTPARITLPAVGACDVGQRQPGVQREQRHLDGKAGEQGQEEPKLQRAAIGCPAVASCKCFVSSGIENVILRAVADVVVVPEHDRQQAQKA